MARFLFVVPPLTGHINPTVSVAAELAARGHDVAWAGHRAVAEPLLPEGARLVDLGAGADPEAVGAVAEKSLSLRGLKALKFLWEDVLIPLGRAMVPGVRRAVEEVRPDVLCIDRQAIGGAIVARSLDLPWATLATTSTARRESIRDLPRVYEWTEERLAEIQREAGLDPVPQVEESPHLVVVFTTLALVGNPNPDPGVYHFVGPSFRHRRGGGPSFPWEELRDVPRLLVSLGTVNPQRGERFFQAVAEALGELPIQVILVAPDSFGPFPDNFLVRTRVPQVDLLPHVQAVVCHAGQNTVNEALAHGLPLVVLPIKDDQPVIAEQVTRSGAGLRLSFARPRPAGLREAVGRVLQEPAFREAAGRIGESFRNAGGSARAAELLERLAAPGAEGGPG